MKPEFLQMVKRCQQQVKNILQSFLDLCRKYLDVKSRGTIPTTVGYTLGLLGSRNRTSSTIYVADQTRVVDKCRERTSRLQEIETQWNVISSFIYFNSLEIVYRCLKFL